MSKNSEIYRFCVYRRSYFMVPRNSRIAIPTGSSSLAHLNRPENGASEGKKKGTIATTVGRVLVSPSFSFSVGRGLPCRANCSPVSGADHSNSTVQKGRV